MWWTSHGTAISQGRDKRARTRATAHSRLRNLQEIRNVLTRARWRASRRSVTARDCRERLRDEASRRRRRPRRINYRVDISLEGQAFASRYAASSRRHSVRRRRGRTPARSSRRARRSKLRQIHAEAHLDIRRTVERLPPAIDDALRHGVAIFAQRSRRKGLWQCSEEDSPAGWRCRRGPWPFLRKSVSPPGSLTTTFLNESSPAWNAAALTAPGSSGGGRTLTDVVANTPRTSSTITAEIAEDTISGMAVPAYGLESPSPPPRSPRIPASSSLPVLPLRSRCTRHS